MKLCYALSYHQFCATMDVAAINDTNVGTKKSALIEIMGEQDLLSAPFHFKEDHPNVLRLVFDDIDEPLHVPLLGEFVDGREYIPVVPMTEEQGRQIVDFVKANKDAYNFIVHCAAGISRSGAIVKFINEYFDGEEWYFRHLNPHTRPNARILNILRRLSQTHGKEDITEG